MLPMISDDTFIQKMHNVHTSTKQLTEGTSHTRWDEMFVK